jgi:hypothetical protein
MPKKKKNAKKSAVTKLGYGFALSSGSGAAPKTKKKAAYQGPVTKVSKRPVRWCEKWVLGTKPYAKRVLTDKQKKRARERARNRTEEQKERSREKARERYAIKVGLDNYKPRPRKKQKT